MTQYGDHQLERIAVALERLNDAVAVLAERLAEAPRLADAWEMGYAQSVADDPLGQVTLNPYALDKPDIAGH